MFELIMSLCGGQPIRESVEGKGVNGFAKEVSEMTKAELVDRVAESTGLTKKLASGSVDAVFNAITDALAKGEKVQLVGFGSFEVRERAARKGRNPRTGEEIDIESRQVPVFRAGKALKDAVR
jgi:DNA-binding protein HU-beta